MLRSSPLSRKKRTSMIILLMVALALIIVFFSGSSSRLSTSTISHDEITEPSIDFAEDFATDDYVAHVPESLSDALPVSKSRALIQPIPADLSGDAPLGDVPTKNIQNGSIALRVENIDQSLVELSRIAESMDGNISHSSLSYGDRDRFGSATLRIPSDKFDRALAQIRSIAISIDSESTHSRDVTREFVDLEAQLTNKKAQEEQIRSFFEQAEGVDELIAIENALSRVRGDVERLQGQMNYLSSQTSFSTITLSLRESVRPIATQSWNPRIVAKDAFAELIDRFQNLFDDALRLSISSLPLFVFSLIGLWALYRVSCRVITLITKKHS